MKAPNCSKNQPPSFLHTPTRDGSTNFLYASSNPHSIRNKCSLYMVATLPNPNALFTYTLSDTIFFVLCSLCSNPLLCSTTFTHTQPSLHFVHSTHSTVAHCSSQQHPLIHNPLLSTTYTQRSAPSISLASKPHTTAHAYSAFSQ